MPSVYLISDTHFSHANICKFLRSDGTKLRPWDDVEEMDEALISNWNSVVKPNDKVYHLGDVTISPKALHILYRLNGDKVLIKGNHDTAKLSQYAPHFRDIRAYHTMDRFILSHVPIHKQSIGRWTANIHGHLHYNMVMDGSKPDTQYFNVSVERINYTPILFEQIRDMYKDMK